MFALLREHSTALSITRLLDAAVFNIAIGNVDSHAKNYSILLQPEISLAPLYDLMTGLAWEGATPNHAQAIGGQRHGSHIHGRHWERMARESGLAPLAAVRRVARIADRILAELPGAAEEVAAMPAGAGPFLQLFVDAISVRAREVRDHSLVRGEEEVNELGASTEPSEPPGGASVYPS
jgi:serine/threonine-protein kinase HipA